MAKRSTLFLVSFIVCTLVVIISTGAQPAGDKLVVHEWGTFTNVVTPNGAAQTWRPLDGPSELPGFVYVADYAQREGRSFPCVKCGTIASVRMETPVLYFYADRAINVEVKVNLPQGRITEWFPHASEITVNQSSALFWRNVAVLPSSAEAFPQDNSRSHYYPARETDAAPLRVMNGSKTENEKFLFYRGIGNFNLPLGVKLVSNRVQLTASHGVPPMRIFIFEKRGDQLGWRTCGMLKNTATCERPELGQPLAPLLHELEGALVAEGLYAKEAAAMVNTWRDAWFEEGLRVFSLLPRQETDRILPITITPLPTELTRVMVSRTEILTIEMQQEILSALTRFANSQGEERLTAIRTVAKYGGFADVVLRHEMFRPGGSPDAVSQLVEAVRQHTTTSRSLRASR